MKALSIKQPWAWLIIHGGKDIENRTWHTSFRGRFYVHASKSMTRRDYQFAAEYAAKIGVQVPPADQLLRGGIIGSVNLVDSTSHHTSPWYMGEKALVLEDPKPLPFYQVKGQLGFFYVADNQ